MSHALNGLNFQPVGAKAYVDASRQPRCDSLKSQSTQALSGRVAGDSMQIGPLSTCPDTFELRQESTLEFGECNSVSAAGGHPRRPTLVDQALCQLAPLARDCSLLLAQPEFATQTLRSMGFANKGPDVGTGNPFHLSTCSPECCCILVITVGKDVSKAVEIVQALDKNPDAPSLINVLIMSGCQDADAWSQTESKSELSLQLAKEFIDARAKLLKAGTDDIIGLRPGEALQPLRLVEAVERTEYFWKRAAEKVREETAKFKEVAEKKLQVAYKKFLSDLPGRECENIPRENLKLDEHLETERGIQTGVGHYRFEQHLGAGSFGSVQKAIAPDGSLCAIKVIKKSTMRHAKAYFSADREVCLMMHLEPHPHVVRALDVLHGKYGIYVVMQFGGHLNLHAFTMKTCQASGEGRLPEATRRSFLLQETSALAHLHLAKVCHRDLKPTNWIVSDCGQNLRLADFGLAMQLVHLKQKLTDIRGSFPFVAPEVFVDSKSGGAYDPFKADIWSLGLNFAELTRGPYSIEKMLGWVPNVPEDTSKKVADLRTLAQKWADSAASVPADLHEMISEMLVVDFTKRCNIERTMQRLNIAEVSDVQDLHKVQKRQKAQPHFLKTEVTANRRVEAIDHSDALEQLGGIFVFRNALDTMFNSFVNTLGFGEVYEKCPERIPEARELFTVGLPSLLERSHDAVDLQAVMTNFETVHEGLVWTRAHAKVMSDCLLAAFHFAGIDAVTSQPITDWFTNVMSGCLQPFVRRAEQAIGHMTPAWKEQVLKEVEGELLTAFSIQAKQLVQENPKVRRKALQDFPATRLEDHFREFLTGPGRPCPFPGTVMVNMVHAQRLSLINLLQDAFIRAGWRQEVAEALHFAMLQEWQIMADHAASVNK